MVPRRMMDSPDTKSCKEGQGRQMGVMAMEALTDTEGTALLVPPTEGELSPKAAVPGPALTRETLSIKKSGKTDCLSPNLSHNNLLGHNTQEDNMHQDLPFSQSLDKTQPVWVPTRH